MVSSGPKKQHKTFEGKLDQIANLIADAVISNCGDGPDGFTLEHKILAFKELKNYYATLKKLHPDKEGGSFGGFAESINNLESRGRNDRGPAVDVESGAVPGDNDF